jgi:hypothetical protein
VIVFDTNKPIATPTWVNTIDIARPQSAITRIIARVRKVHRKKVHTLLVRWSGRDRGSGVGAFDVDDSRGGARFTLWQLQTAPTGATLACRAGSRYRFYTVARDRANNLQVGRRVSRSVRCR